MKESKDLGYCLICVICRKVKQIKEFKHSLICDDCQAKLKELVKENVGMYCYAA